VGSEGRSVAETRCDDSRRSTPRPNESEKSPRAGGGDVAAAARGRRGVGAARSRAWAHHQRESYSSRRTRTTRAAANADPVGRRPCRRPARGVGEQFSHDECTGARARPSLTQAFPSSCGCEETSPRRPSARSGHGTPRLTSSRPSRTRLTTSLGSADSFGLTGRRAQRVRPRTSYGDRLGRPSSSARRSPPGPSSARSPRAATKACGVPHGTPGRRRMAMSGRVPRRRRHVLDRAAITSARRHGGGPGHHPVTSADSVVRKMYAGDRGTFLLEEACEGRAWRR